MSLFSLCFPVFSKFFIKKKTLFYDQIINLFSNLHVFLDKVIISKGGSLPPPAEHITELSPTYQEKRGYTKYQIYQKILVPYKNKVLFFTHTMYTLWTG